jgi:GH15 family glucan-1,4-alpha-glucosidase
MQATPLRLDHPCAIEDYAIIGDCRTAALVSRAGAIDWLCLPDFSSPALFAALLDPASGGRCSIRPRVPFESNRRYLGQTAVLETIFTTDAGAARLIDLAPLNDGVRPLQPMREVLRVIEGAGGSVELDIMIDPRPDYARRQASPHRRGSLGWAYAWDNEILVVHSDIELAIENGVLTGSVRLAAGERRYLSFAYTRADPAVVAPLGAEADRRLAETLAWWERWTARCRYDGPYRDAVVRSLIALKLLSYAPSGAIVAAPTTSLPETIGGPRNWDYRYCWLRDAGLTCQALMALGYGDEAHSFLGWMLHATRLTWPALSIMYDVFGRTGLRERELAHLAGYRGSKPVRIGNGAYGQRQLDVYGEVVMAADTVAANGTRLDAIERRMLRGFGATACRLWREPDSGIWETRGPPRQFTLSKVMCWAALDRLLKLQVRGALELSRTQVARFDETRAAIADTVESQGFNTTLGSYTSELDGDKLDASLLLMACIGYKDPGDPRMRGTFDLIEQRLARDGLLQRYENAPEGAFGICSFWAIDNLACRGEVEAADRRFRRMLGFANDVGLYAEEIDLATGAALGNFPQGFTHIGLINAAVAIESARKRQS